MRKATHKWPRESSLLSWFWKTTPSFSAKGKDSQRGDPKQRWKGGFESHNPCIDLNLLLTVSEDRSILFIVPPGRLGLREGKQLAQGHRANKAIQIQEQESGRKAPAYNLSTWRWRQKDCQKFETSPVCKASSRPTRGPWRDYQRKRAKGES